MEILLLTSVGSGFHPWSMIDDKHYYLTLWSYWTPRHNWSSRLPHQEGFWSSRQVGTETAGTGVQHMPRNVAVYISISLSVELAPQNWQHKETIQGGLNGKHLQTVKLDCNSIKSTAGLNIVDSESWSHEVDLLHV